MKNITADDLVEKVKSLIAAGVLADEKPDILAMLYDAPILVWLGECDRHSEKEEECMKALELHVRLIYKTFSRNQKKNKTDAKAQC